VTGEALTTRIAEVLKILSDGKWHLLEELQQSMKLTSGQMQKIAEFLGEYKFVTFDDSKKGVKLDEAARKFLE
jgi:DNA-binding IclR family transcriptional regulator